MNLQGNKILITGGTSGIGRTLAFALKNKGNQVIITGRNIEKLEAMAREGFTTISCDMQQQSDLEKTVTYLENHHPDLNILINNAGVQFNYQLTESGIPYSQIQQEINTNVTGQIILTQMLIPLLNDQKQSFIVNTTSGLGAFPKTDGLVYSATKAAMRNFTTGLRLALKGRPLKVLEFIPPVTETGMTNDRTEPKMSPEQLVNTILPQMEREKQILTVPKMRLFLWIAFLFPGLAHKILSK